VRRDHKSSRPIAGPGLADGDVWAQVLAMILKTPADAGFILISIDAPAAFAHD